MKSATAFAPATVGNAAVGFDLLGFAIDGVGDEVTLARAAAKGIVIEKIEGAGGVTGMEGLPTDPAKNAATAGLLKLVQDQDLDFGFRAVIRKGIPLGSGMGGSAASAVAALVAANAFLDPPLSREKLLRYALEGERVASGSAHPDNITPCLFGGLTLTRSVEPVDVVRVPVPAGISCVLVHPHARLDTKEARRVLKRTVALDAFVRQSANLAGFLAGCYSGDLALVSRSLSDVVIEPQRAPLIPGFAAVKRAALEAGALGCSISGSGPSVFAWVDSARRSESVRDAMTRAFTSVGLASDYWVSAINAQGAAIISKEPQWA